MLTCRLSLLTGSVISPVVCISGRLQARLQNEHSKMKSNIAIVCLLFVSVSPLLSDEVDFVRAVRPIFEKHCYSCHGEKKQKSGYRLDIKSEAFKGGDNYDEDIIVPGESKESLLFQFVSDPDADLQMPPTDEGLTAKEIEILKRWIDEGAVWPDRADRAKLKDLRDYWSFKPIGNPLAPRTNADWPRNDIDRFILARQRTHGIQPAKEADRVTWLRRVSFDLVGLPPSPEQVREFLNDSSDSAYERVVERLLNSPRYGERWSQHWLDVVRYADTHGFEVNTERPNAWPYRDYVIRAFNEDTPYNQFILEQMVGDAMGKDAATGFLVTASVLLPGQIGKDAPSKRLARQDAIDEVVVNVSQSFLGLSVGCARCHDHKFDPITQRDYYSMQAFVAGVEYNDRELLTAEAAALRKQVDKFKQRIAAVDQALTRFIPLAKSGNERPMINARQNIDRFVAVKTQQIRFTIRTTNTLEPCLDEIEVFNTAGDNIALATEGTEVKSSGDNVSPNRHELRFINDGQYGNSRSWMSNRMGAGWVELEFAKEQEIDRVVWGRDRNGQFGDRLAIDYTIEVVDADGNRKLIADASDRKKFDPAKKIAPTILIKLLSEEEARIAKPLIREKADLEAKIKAAASVQRVFAGTFRKPDEIRLLSRGDPEQPKEVVLPAVPVALGKLRVSDVADEQQRRKALADWIASPKNPLTARVMVNRIWQWHFGIGIVETANDFGHGGQKPSHPLLLDWLAREFVRSGWSIKHMHRLIVLSATYRQAARSDHRNAAQKDADVRLLWRYPARRMDAETIRDSMLAVSGQLNLKMYGRGFDLFVKRGGLTGFTPVQHFSGEGLRRMIYAHKVRRERDAIFGAFDCPDAGQSTARRRDSTTPIQALNLFNSHFTIEQAKAFAARVKAVAGSDVDKQIQQVYWLALNRKPSQSEVQRARPVVESHGLSTLCRVVFNSNEFLFIR